MKHMRRSDRMVSDRQELQAMLESAEICRLGFANNNIPYIVPLSFGYQWLGELPVLYFHGARSGRKLAMLAVNNQVCFEIDRSLGIIRGGQACEWSTAYESIIGYGTLEISADEHERTSGLDAIMAHYGATGVQQYQTEVFNHTSVLKLTVASLSGKRKALS